MVTFVILFLHKPDAWICLLIGIHFNGEQVKLRGLAFFIVVNMELSTKSLSTVVVGQHSGASVGFVTFVEIPFLVNPHPLKEGESLYMAISPKRDAPKREYSWEDAVSENEKKDKATAAAPKPKAKIAKCSPCESELI